MSEFSKNSIETVSGRLVDVTNPDPKSFVIGDIAWSLSREPRFAGHTIHELPYTVAQHSIVVANIVRDALNESHESNNSFREYFKDKKSILIAGESFSLKSNLKKILKLALLHDASEAYLRDIPSPIKSIPGLKEAYSKIESNVMEVILREFDCQFASEEQTKAAWSIVHWADMYARTIEAYHLMPSRGLNWLANNKLIISKVDLLNFEMPKPFLEVHDDFIYYYEDLS